MLPGFRVFTVLRWAIIFDRYRFSNEAPFSHHHELVTVTKTKFGDTFDWNETPAGRLFKVKTSSEKPENAYIATHYRGHWFYIEDTNLESKSTFMLLRQLFDLQAGQKQSTGPTLTLPVR